MTTLTNSIILLCCTCLLQNLQMFKYMTWYLCMLNVVMFSDIPNIFYWLNEIVYYNTQFEVSPLENSAQLYLTKCVSAFT